MGNAGQLQKLSLCKRKRLPLAAEGETARARAVQTLFQEELEKEYSAFAACFSFRRDDAAQWER